LGNVVETVLLVLTLTRAENKVVEQDVGNAAGAEQDGAVDKQGHNPVATAAKIVVNEAGSGLIT